MNVRLTGDTEWDISYLLSTGIYPGIGEFIDISLQLKIEAGRNDHPTGLQDGSRQSPIRDASDPVVSASSDRLTELWDERDSWIVTLPPRSSALLQELLLRNPNDDPGGALESAITHLCEVRKREHFHAALQVGLDQADGGNLIEVTERWRSEIRLSVHETHRERQRNTLQGRP